jgi:hypothetical protein
VCSWGRGRLVGEVAKEEEEGDGQNRSPVMLQRTVTSVEVALLELGRIRAGKHVSEVRGEKLERIGPKRGLGVVGAHRNHRRSSSESAALGDLLRAGWWRCWAIDWGEM